MNLSNNTNLCAAAKIKPHSRFLTGFTITEMMIVVAIIGMLLLFTVFSTSNAKYKVYKDTCIDNLRRIHTAKELFANEHNKVTGDNCLSTDIGPYIQGGTASLFCPSDSSRSFAASYLINNIGTTTPPTCRILPNGKDGVQRNSDDHRITP